MPQVSTSRPYSQHGIIKLEALYGQSRGDEEVVAAIWAELQHRNTERAKRLQHRITVEIAEQLLSSQAAPTNASAPSASSTPAPSASQSSAPAVELSIGEQEGMAVLQLLRAIAQAAVRNPDVYVISPFRVVAHEMRQLLRSEPELFAAFGVQEHRFLEERVGTIHTFQGKEAEAVIAVLGAPLENQRGARQWAASTPNILNVMVSRAKSRLYVVGSHDAWSGVGHFAELARHLRRRNP
jgi:AAA domain